MARIGRALAVLLLVWGAAASGADEVELVQKSDAARIGIEDTLVVTISASGFERGAPVRLPRSTDFQVLSTTKSSELSFSLKGGQARQRWIEKTTLTLRPRRTGKLVLPGASVVANGRTYRAEPTEVEVVDGSLRRRSNPTPNPFAGLLDGLEIEATVPIEIPRGGSDLFLRLAVDEHTAYVGEQITLTLELFGRVEISSVEAVEMPELEGFWVEDSASPTRLMARSRTVEGIPYRSYLLKEQALFAMSPGERTLEPASADVTTGYMFGGRMVRRKSERVTIRVLPLPEEGRPVDFADGNVGRFELQLSAPRQATVGSPLEVQLRVEGEGNIGEVVVPTLERPEGVRAYEPTVEKRQIVRSGRVGGHKTVTYVLMPDRPGTLQLPEVRFSYFDPTEGSYRTVTRGPQQIEVLAPEAGTGSAALAASGPYTLQPMRTSADLTGGNGSAPGAALFWLLTLGTPLAGALVLLVHGVRSRRRTILGRSALDTGPLGRAGKLRDRGPPERFWSEIEQALTEAAAERTGTPMRSRTRAEVRTHLARAGVGPAAIERWGALMDVCEQARFATGAAPELGRDAAWDEAAAVIDALEGR